MNTKTLLTHKGFEKLTHGHPWLLNSDFKDLKLLPAGIGLVQLGEHWFFNSPMSKIRLRRFGPTTRDWEKAEGLDIVSDPTQFKEKFGLYLVESFSNILLLKKQMLIKESEDLCLRWLFSEADLIPGLIVDVFKTKLACQISTAPIQLFWPAIKTALIEAFERILGETPEVIELKNSAVRLKEGLDIVEPPPSSGDWYYWNDLYWWMTPGGDQKTGAYLDQKWNHKQAQHWIHVLGLKNVWDLCSFEGGFGLHIAKSNVPVVAVDQSNAALETARKNAIKNDISDEIFQTVNQDVFSFLRDKFDLGRKVEAIVLDPPSFVKSKADLANALKGYKELNLRSMHCLKPEGLLVSCACSQNISREEYLKMLRSAAHDARRTVHVLEVRGASPDHAPLVNFPESDYLQAWFLKID